VGRDPASCTILISPKKHDEEVDMATTEAAAAPARSDTSALDRLEHLPVTMFTLVMGFGGTAVAWQRAASVVGAPAVIGRVLAWFALAVFTVVAVAYAVKVARFLPVVRAEWRNPVKMAFVPTGSIGLIIVSLGLLDVSRPPSAVLWWTGAVLQFVLTLDILRTWIADPHVVLGHVHPAWFIPVVGNLVVPLAGVAHAPAGVNWYFFSLGLAWWLILLPLVVGRLVVGGALPAKLTPTLAVFVAPPAVAGLAWVRLGGHWSDPAGQLLLNVTVFQLLLLAVQARTLLRVPFAISAWAYTFPLAAAASALMAAGGSGLGDVYVWLGTLVLAVLTVLVAVLATRTALAVARGEICRPEQP
jgi:tellurite resistance protein